MIQLNFGVFAALILGSISTFGILFNSYVFYKLSTKSGIFSGFHKLCLVKTIPNCIVCTVFLIWPTPLCLLQPLYTSIPKNLNVAFGQVAGWGAFIMGPILQSAMSCNRFYVLYFPMRSMKGSNIPITNVFIGFTFVIAVIFTILGFPDHCGYVFDPDAFSWRAEDFPCAIWLADFMFYTVLAISMVSCSLNFATFLKLVCNQVVGVSSNDSVQRRRRRINMYIQSVTQDTLHLTDMVNCTFIYKWNSAVWFQFIFLCVSFLSIHALDGFVMVFFRPEIHPKWLQAILMKKSEKSTNSVFVSVRSRISVNVTS